MSLLDKQEEDVNKDADSSDASDKDEGWESSTQKTVPYERFQKVNTRLKEIERQLASSASNRTELNADVRKMKNEGALEDDFKIPENTPFDEAIKMVAKHAKEQALREIRAEQSNADAEVKRYERIIDDGFESLRDDGNNITKKEESEMLDIIRDYKISIENPEDFKKVYDLYKKTKGSTQKNTFSLSQKSASPKVTKVAKGATLSQAFEAVRQWFRWN